MTIWNTSNKRKLSRGALRLVSPSTTTCVVAGTWYPIAGTWADTHNLDFETDSSGLLTYIGYRDITVLFIGSSDVEADKTCTVNYGLYKNGVIIDPIGTIIEFNNPNVIRNVGTNLFMDLVKDDTLKLYVKSDASNTVVSHNVVTTTCYGE